MDKKFVLTISITGFVGLLTGSLFANIYCSDNVGEWGVFGYDFLSKINSMSFDGEQLFNHIFVERGKIWLLLALLSISMLGNVFRLCYILYFGFMSGMTCSSAVMIHGGIGVIYYLFLVLISQLVFLVSVVLIMNTGLIIKNNWPKHFLAIKIVPIVLCSFLMLMISVSVETFFNINFAKIFG